MSCNLTLHLLLPSEVAAKQGEVCSARRELEEVSSCAQGSVPGYYGTSPQQDAVSLA